MLEEILVTARHNAYIDPGLQIWDWRISVYLFLGGLTAGIMFFSAWMLLARKDEEAPFAVNRLALLAPVVLSVGMTTLFLDLSHKLYVWRFYTTFQPTSPMSYGAWILVLVYPITILQILSTLRQGYPALARPIDRLDVGRWLLDVIQSRRRLFAWLAIPTAVALGIYTGILLSAFSARPFWNTGLLGILFLVSGLSTGAALTALMARRHGEKRLFTLVDAGLIVLELGVVALLLINLSTGPQQQLEALRHLIGGNYALLFWGVFVSIGLMLPLLLELVDLRMPLGKLAILAPVLVLLGGYVLRVIAVDLGQESTWTQYESEYNAQWLQRLDDE
jgi:formate-dependent nitrite reductase membrane component NrfD